MTEIPRNMDDALAAFKKMVDEDPVIQSLKKWIADEEEKYLRRLMDEVVRLVTEREKNENRRDRGIPRMEEETAPSP